MANRYPPREEFSLSKLIVCEGKDDEAFIRALIKHLNLTSPHIRNNTDSTPLGQTPSGGITHFGRTLNGFKSNTGFEKVKHILILADNDEDPIKNFDIVKDQIAALSSFGNPTRKYPVPTAPLTLASGDPEITILMIPYTGIKGNLETLCLDAARTVSPSVTSCVDTFATCAKADGWTEIGKKAKMQIRSIFAAGHHSDPAIGLGKVWNDAPHLIPINHASFNQISTVLQAFC